MIKMIVIGFGANIPSKVGSPLETCEAAIIELETRGIKVVKRSRWWRTEPIPVSDQPWFVNGVAVVETKLEPEELLAELHQVENAFGRKRMQINDPRTLDLDLLAYDDLVIDKPLDLPHRRMHNRAFVLMPLKEVAPEWRHPRTKRSIDEMLAELSTVQRLIPNDEYEASKPI